MAPPSSLRARFRSLTFLLVLTQLVAFVAGHEIGENSASGRNSLKLSAGFTKILKRGHKIGVDNGGHPLPLKRQSDSQLSKGEKGSQSGKKKGSPNPHHPPPPLRGPSSTPPPAQSGNQSSTDQDGLPSGYLTATTVPGFPTPSGINYYGGLIMAAPINIYLIWYGNWIQPYANCWSQAIIRNFINSFGPSNPVVTVGSSQPPTVRMWYKINLAYYDKRKLYVSPNVTLKNETTDKYSQGVDLPGNKVGVVRIVTRAITQTKTLPLDANGIYVVLTSPDVTEARDTSSYFCGDYCGYHSHATINKVNVRYAFIGNPASQCMDACGRQFTANGDGYQPPNGDMGTDAMISVLGHELSETVTDPDGVSWGDSAGNENADKCAWKFGTLYAEERFGGYNNMQGKNGWYYFVQQNWHLTKGVCVTYK